MNTLKIKLLAVVFVGITLGMSGLALYSNQITETDRSPIQSSDNRSFEVSEPGRDEISYTARPGITSLEQLQSEATDVVVVESEYGRLVDSIEGHKGGTDGYYWNFYVNDEMAQVGADAYIQKEGDRVVWKFQKL